MSPAIGQQPRPYHRAHLPVARVEHVDEPVAGKLIARSAVLDAMLLDAGVGRALPPEGLPPERGTARASGGLLPLEVFAVVADDAAARERDFSSHGMDAASGRDISVVNPRRGETRMKVGVEDLLITYWSGLSRTPIAPNHPRYL